MDARLRAITRYFQSCPGLAQADLSGLARELHPYLFICKASASDGGDISFSFVHLGRHLERELRRSALKSSRDILLPEVLGVAALGALNACALSQNAIWLREAATTSDQSGRVIEMTAVPLQPDHICGGILYSPTAWFFAQSPVVKVRPLAGKPPRPGAPPSLRVVPPPDRRAEK
jgi:hypothetical protein